MAECNFCKDEFQCEQGVKAHLKTCELYLAEKAKKARAASGSLPQGAAAPDLSVPKLDVVKSIQERSSKQDASPTPQQQRRTILQAVKIRVIDRHVTLLGQVTTSMRGHAKLIIEQKLARLPLEEIGFEEACEIAVAIRDRLYAPTFKRQALEAARQDAEHESRRRKQIEEMAAGHRADRRKTTLIEQAIGQARARCEAKQIVGWNRLSVLVDIESQLKEFLTGSESVPDAHAIIQTVLDARFAEAEAKQDAARAKADAQWYEGMAGLLVLGVLLATPLLALKYPAHTLAIFRWIQQTFGFTPKAEAGALNPNASETTPPAASAEARPRSKRWRKYPVAPPSPASSWAPSVGPPEPEHT